MFECLLKNDPIVNGELFVSGEYASFNMRRDIYRMFKMVCVDVYEAVSYDITTHKEEIKFVVKVKKSIFEELRNLSFICASSMVV